MTKKTFIRLCNSSKMEVKLAKYGVVTDASTTNNDLEVFVNYGDCFEDDGDASVSFNNEAFKRAKIKGNTLTMVADGMNEGTVCRFTVNEIVRSPVNLSKLN